MIIFIAAQDDNGGIGYQGRVPWPRMQADRELLHKLTSGKIIAMGRKSYEEFKHIKSAFEPKEVLIISGSLTVEGQAACSAEEIINRSKTEEIWVLGGAEVFNHLMPFAKTIYLTEINETFPADTFMPKINKENWRLTETESHKKDANNPYDYIFSRYERTT